MNVTPPIYTLPIPTALDTDPVTALLQAVEHLAAQGISIYSNRAELRLTAYHDALCSLASTYGDNAQRLYNRATERLPSGTLLECATPEQMRRTTLAIHGLTRDRLTHGTVARSLDTWLEIADEAVRAYRLARAA